MPVLRQERREEDRCRCLDMHEVPEGDYWWCLYPDYTCCPHRSCCDQEAQGGPGEVNTFGLMKAAIFYILIHL